MKTTITTLCIALSLTLGASAPALADRGHHGDRHGGYQGRYYAPPANYRGGHDGGYYSRNRWAGPAAVLAITGIAAGIAASAYYAPNPVYVTPPQPVYLEAPRPVYVVPQQPGYAPPPGVYWGY